MAKHLTKAELAELSRIGTVKYDPKDLNIARFGELIGKLDELLRSQADRTQADLARSQAQLEVLAVLQKQINSRGTKSQVSNVTVDLTPLQVVLEELKNMQAYGRGAYRFTVHRDPNSGYMSSVVAEPVEPMKH